MKEVKIEKCPYCGGEEFIETSIGSYGSAVLFTSVTRNAILKTLVCRSCGSVVRLFTETPEKLYPKKDRRE